MVQPEPKRLRTRRERLGISLDDVCVEIGRPGNASELSRWERGKRKTIPGHAQPEQLDRFYDAIEQKAKAS